jgi:glyoxylase-like metal-dependent hydrolase (beta-lactamase superfamily II)
VLGGLTACSDSGDSTDETADSSVGSGGSSDLLQWAQASLGSVSAYVLVRGTQAAVVDTGRSDSADQIGEALGTLGVAFDDVRHIVLTHSHPDHVGSLAEVTERAPRAAAYAGSLDIPNISAPIDVFGLGDGDDVFGLQVIDTPGHTPGSISVFDPGIGLLVAGDALNGNADGSEISGPNPDFTPDMDTATASLSKFVNLDVVAMAPGHGQPVRQDASTLIRSLVEG